MSEYELIALLVADGFEADGIGVQLVDAGLGHQPHEQAGIHAAGEQHAHIHGGQLAAAHGEAQFFQQLPRASPRSSGVHPRRIALEGQLPVATLGRVVPSASTVSVVPGASFSMAAIPSASAARRSES
jgi:hypothetical protein